MAFKRKGLAQLFLRCLGTFFPFSLQHAVFTSLPPAPITQARSPGSETGAAAGGWVHATTPARAAARPEPPCWAQRRAQQPAEAPHGRGTLSPAAPPSPALTKLQRPQPHAAPSGGARPALPQTSPALRRRIGAGPVLRRRGEGGGAGRAWRRGRGSHLEGLRAGRGRVAVTEARGQHGRHHRRGGRRLGEEQRRRRRRPPRPRAAPGSAPPPPAGGGNGPYRPARARARRLAQLLLRPPPGSPRRPRPAPPDRGAARTHGGAAAARAGRRAPAAASAAPAAAASSRCCRSPCGRAARPGARRRSAAVALVQQRGAQGQHPPRVGSAERRRPAREPSPGASAADELRL